MNNNRRMNLLVKIWSPSFLVVVSGGFLAAVFASPSFPSVNEILLILLVANVAFCLISIALECCRRRKDDNDDSSKAACGRTVEGRAELLFVVAPSLSLTILLLVRLFSVNHFQTIPSLLDFGPKKGDAEANDPNIAFLGAELTSFGHCIQGFLASFLWTIGYMTASWLKRRQRGPEEANAESDGNSWQGASSTFLKTVAYCFTIYPTYNFVKRFVRNQETFATSSYMNNGMEWVLGFWTGMAMGFLFEAATCRNGRRNAGRGNDGEEETETTTIESGALPQANTSVETTMVRRTAYNGRRATNTTTPNPEDDKNTKCWGLLVFGRFLGVLYLCSVFGACAMTGITWNSCYEGSLDCVNYDDGQNNIVIISFLVLIPVFFVLVALC